MQKDKTDQKEQGREEEKEDDQREDEKQEDQEDDQGKDQPEEEKKLSKAQKKKLKNKLKKQGVKEQKKDDDNQEKKKKKSKQNNAAILAAKKLELLEKQKQEQEMIERQQREQQELERKLREQELKRQKQEKERKVAEKKAQNQRLKKEGLYYSKGERQKMQRIEMARKIFQEQSNQALKTIEQKNNLKSETNYKKKKKQLTLQQIYQLKLEEKNKIQTVQKIQQEKEEQQLNNFKNTNDQLQQQNLQNKQQTQIKQTTNIQTQEQMKLNIQKKHKKKDKKNKTHQFQQYRSPICCILGHVDTGKTTLLDKIRHTHVQQGQAGGITQQIGATFFPKQKLIQQVNKCKSTFPIEVKVPGLLIIDTPGHQSFSNLRVRGSSLCDIAILVIDLMHGLQKQTLESLQLLTSRKTPFIVALNKLDLCYEWKKNSNSSSYVSLQKQNKNTIEDYKNRLEEIELQLNQKGFNNIEYWKNKEEEDFISLVPTSGKTGQGIPDLLSVIMKFVNDIPSINERIKVKINKFNCTVIQKKMIQGHGTTLDCLLVDGCIQKEDKIVLLGFNGPIVTKVRALLTPHPMKQMRIKGEFIFHHQIYGAMGVKISAPSLEDAVVGTPLFVANNEQEIELAKNLVSEQLANVKKKIKLSVIGVGMAASTLGSLEALLQYLKNVNIPVSYVKVGPVSRQDIMKAMKSILNEQPEKRKKEFSCMLVFDIKVLPQARKFAEENDVKIFEANIIYHLTGQYYDFGTFYQSVNQVRQKRIMELGKDAVFPCLIQPIAIFRRDDPIILGVDVIDGIIKIGTPLITHSKEKIKIGVVQSIEFNHKSLKQARKQTGSVAIKLKNSSNISTGRQFNLQDKLCSQLSRKSIDALKEHFKNQKYMKYQDWLLVKQLKEFQQIP